MPKITEDLTSRRFGKLVVIRFHERIKGKWHNDNFWWCRCDCGNEKAINSIYLRYGDTKSCGCLRHKLRKATGEVAITILYGIYKRMAKNRNLCWEFTKDEFKEITSSNCAYCGAPPSLDTKRKDINGNYLYNGIDRVDNKLGYTKNNCLPCCNMCNMAKRTHGLQIFVEWIDRISSHRSKHLNQYPTGYCSSI